MVIHVYVHRNKSEAGDSSLVRGFAGSQPPSGPYTHVTYLKYGRAQTELQD